MSTFLQALLAPTSVPDDPSLAIDQSLAAEVADISEVLGMVRTFRKEVVNSKRGQRLAAPGCSAGCATCFRACAIARIKLRWWEDELVQLTGGAATSVSTTREGQP